MKDVTFCLAGSILCFFSLISGLYADERETLKSGLSICLTTDRAVYSCGHSIKMHLEVSNRTNEAITLHFSDAQRFEFVIKKEQEGLWRWSDGRMFAQVLGEKTLEPGESVTYTARFEETLSPGTYTVEGMIVSTLSPLTACLAILVK